MGAGRSTMSEDMADKVNVTKIEISPNECEISSELKLGIEFSLDTPLSNAVWAIKYIVDYTNKRKELVMGRIEMGALAVGEQHKLTFEVPKVDVSGILDTLLLNVGLLLAVLTDGAEEVLQISCVTQVTKAQSGELVRNIFN